MAWCCSLSLYDYPARYDELSPGLEGDIEFYLELARLATPPVLDIGCGTGRITMPIARAGIPVLGLDRSAAMIAAAQSRARRIASADWVQADMRDFRLDRRFGLIIIAYRGFIHLLTEPDQRAALASIYEHLAPGGRLSLDVFNPAIVGSITGSATRRHYSTTQPGVRLRYVYPNELRGLLAESGFEIQAVYGGFDRTPFDEARSPEMIVVARRPAGG